MDIHLSEGTIVTLILAAVGYLISVGIWLVKMKWDVKRNSLQLHGLMSGFDKTVKRFGRLARDCHTGLAKLGQKLDDHIKDNDQEHARIDRDIKDLKE